MPDGFRHTEIGGTLSPHEHLVTQIAWAGGGEKAVSWVVKHADFLRIDTEFRRFRVYCGEYGQRNTFTRPRDTPAIREPGR